MDPMLEHPGNRRHGERDVASRTHFPQTLVLLDYYSAEEEIPVKPVLAGGRHRAPSPGWRDRRRVAAAAAAVVIATGGSLLGGSLAMHSPSRATVSASRETWPQFVLVTTVPNVTRSASPVAARGRHRKNPPSRPAPVLRAPSPAPSARPTPTPTPTPTHKAAPPAIVAAYRVDTDWGTGFQAEIDITNNGTKPINAWQIVVALPQDQFTSWWNASGYANNGVLLLSQAPWQGTLAPHGGTWRVYFIASGPQRTPTACAFNGIACSG